MLINLIHWPLDELEAKRRANLEKQLNLNENQSRNRNEN